MIDWNDTIVLINKKKGKIAVPRSVIKYLGTKPDRDYSSGDAKDIETAYIHVDLKWAKTVGINIMHYSLRDECVELELGMDFKIVLGLLRGDKAAEVLF